jgi:hypothetical protein
MKKTSEQQIESMKIDLLIMQAELASYLHGDWRYEYYMTIGYNKKYTGRKIYTNTVDKHADIQ